MSRTDEKCLALLRIRYQAADRKEQGMILDEFVKTTGYHRKHATALLNSKRGYAKGIIRRPRSTWYGPGLVPALLVRFDVFDGICSKLLRAAMDVELPRLYAAGSLQMNREVYEKLMQISPASIDRLLVGCRPQLKASRLHQARLIAQAPDSCTHLGRLDRRPSWVLRNGFGRPQRWGNCP